ncbi:MAG: hypothetical protein V1913_12860 [Fibrobacterota bacterium]
MRTRTALLTLLVITVLAATAAETQFSRSVKAGSAPAPQEESFVIKKPGEITFTSGIVIEGRVEKPQVMLVFIKERIKLEPVVFRQSPIGKITEPLRITPLEAGAK